ncbi:MAG TPA: methyltransferase domain-containing protein [Elusimicrobiota bacterium]|nr:methyltransferase domain-containing protein [Elusimicrobiota bacterium]
MLREALEFLVSPCCRRELSLAAGPGKSSDIDVDEGTLTCPCGRIYPIVHGIPVLIREETLSDPVFENNRKTWNALWKKTRDMASTFFTSGEMFRYDFQCDNSIATGAVVFEAGVGQGKYVSYLRDASPAWLIGVDAAEYLHEIWDNLKSGPRFSCKICLVRADLNDLPIRSGKFDYVIASRVLHHLPRMDKSLSDLLSLLKPKGKMLAVVYAAGGSFRHVIDAVERIKKILNVLCSLDQMYVISFFVSAVIYAVILLFYVPLGRFLSVRRLLPLGDVMLFWKKIGFRGFWKYIVFDILVAPETRYTVEEDLKKILSNLPVSRRSYRRQHEAMWSIELER